MVLSAASAFGKEPVDVAAAIVGSGGLWMGGSWVRGRPVTGCDAGVAGGIVTWVWLGTR